jgi:hypothetical protein
MENKTTILRLQTLIKLLEHYSQKNHLTLNLIKLTEMMNISQDELDILLEIVFQFQAIFKNGLQTKSLHKVRKNNMCYLSLSDCQSSVLNTGIELSKIQCNLLSDMIFEFQYISKGKGFDIRYPSTELIKNIKELKNLHPYFFEYRGNGLVYPTELALKIGKQLEIYNRTNKSVSKITCENYTITII